MNTLTKSLAASLLLVSLAGFCQNITTGLVAYWPMDATNGPTTPDMTTLNNTLNISNAPSVVPGQRSNAFSFNGTSTSQYLTIAHGFTDNDLNGLPIQSSPNGCTIAMWIKGPPVGTGGNANDNYIFTEGSTVSGSPLLLIQTRNGSAAADTNKLDINIRNSSGTTLINHNKSTSIVFDNNWHHIAWVDDRGAAKLYVDGNLDATDFTYAYQPPSAYSLNTTSIGALVRAAVSGTHFNGLMDEVALWDRPLTQGEVRNVMTNGIPLPIPPPVLSVFQPPVSSTNALGDRVVFFLGASGGHPTPLSYQWYENGAPLVDGTAANLILTNLTASGSNFISVIVAKDSASASNSAFLIVLPDPAPALANNLVSYWPFDVVNQSPTATNSPDIYYSHTDMGLVNMDSSSLVPGPFSNALSFNISGLNQYGRRAGGTPIYPTTNYSISLWVNGPSGQANKQIYAEGGTNTAGANGDYFFLSTENPAGGGSLAMRSSASSILNYTKSTQVVLDGTWHHVVWVDENGKARLYVDGVVDATDFTYYRSNLVLIASAVGALYRASAADYFFGSVDELALWNRRLSWTEIQQLHTNGVPLPAPRVPPSITQQPLGSTNNLGDRITLLVLATGSSPLGYQWLKDGAPLTSETNNTLTLFFTAPATNDYALVITNIANSITSQVAHVVAVPDPVADLRTGLSYYWPLDTVTGSQPTATTPDLYSHADLLLNGMDSSYLVPGQFGNALSFAGAQYGNRVGGFPIYLITNYTISLWVNGYGSGQANACVFAEGSAASLTPILTIGTDVAGTSASADFYLRTDSGTALLNHRKSTRPVFDGAWHHLVWVDANGKARLYVDGVLDETDFTYTRGRLTLETTAIGAFLRAAAGNFFYGQIDEVVLWERPLSWSEMQQVQAGAIPAPGAPVAPAIISQPVGMTNFSFASVPKASLSVFASGTGPLSYQWLKDGVAIPLGSNPSAGNNVLSFATIHATDSGGYSVVVTNVAGAVTSLVAQMVFSAAPFCLDFDLTNSPNVQSGFFEITTASSGSSYGGIKVSVAPMGGIALSDRNRVAPPMVVNNPPLLTQAQLYNDSIFAGNTNVGSSLSVLIEQLAPNTPFGVTVWSFDPQSPGARVSDWTEISSGTPVQIVTNYIFDGSVLPTHDYDDTFGALLTSSPQGTLQLVGVSDANNFSYGVFVNAIRLVFQPTVRITNAQLVSGNVRLTVEAQYPGQPLAFEQRADLAAGSWTPATNGTLVEAHGPITLTDFPAAAAPLFYRAAATAP